MAMLDGGIGCIRLTAIEHGGETWYVLGATFSSFCDDGIPVLVRSGEYHSLAERLREEGILIASVAGSVELLPEVVLTHATRLPGYCIRVASVEISPPPTGTHLHASAFVTFESSDNESRRRDETGWLTSYCRFEPGRKGNIVEAVDWLKGYVSTYASRDSRVLADFDAYHNYFPNVALPATERVRSALPISTLRYYAKATGPIFINGDLTLGDRIENVRDSTIINRSAYVIEP
ncbi:hypothetical protein [Motilibacter deserti]|uniref:Uncharacterized protein n=1 Tax=Motilibacter deserti TaxID=2714956 RepID=A0ABX0GY88_9ACTN|nr:hypothetical protein [Motilibacter deserti]NHC15956.1 hypothetical protein [Motilibacter deserti]